MSNSAPFFKAHLSNFQKYGCDAAVLLGHMSAQIAWHGKGVWFHSVRALAEELGLTPKKVRTALAKLVDAGELRVQKAAGPNNTCGYRLGQSTAEQVVAQGKPSATVGQTGCFSRANRFIPQGKPNKKEIKRKKSMQEEMPACSSSIDRDCQELVEAIRPLQLNDRDTLSLAKEAKVGGVTAHELNDLVADVQRKNAANPGGLLRVKLRGSDVQRLRNKRSSHDEADVRRRIEANAELLIAQLESKFGSGAANGLGLDRKTGTWTVFSGHTFNLTMSPQAVLEQINCYQPAPRFFPSTSFRQYDKSSQWTSN